MFVRIDNTPRDYAWGSRSAIAGFRGRPESGGPEAELWLGAHAGSPARLVDAASVGHADLAQWIAADPVAALGGELAREPEPRLPFLLKVLAAGAPLSLQAHPTPEQARAGYAREDDDGVALDAYDRNYKDRFHKPELIVAVSDTFDALSGFRPLAEVRAILQALRDADASSPAPEPGALDLLEAHLGRDAPLADTVEWLLRDGRGGDTGEAAWVIERVVALSGSAFGCGLALRGLVRHRARARRGVSRRPRPGHLAAAQPGAAAPRRGAVPRGRQHPRVPRRARHRAHGRERQRAARGAHAEAHRRE